MNLSNLRTYALAGRSHFSLTGKNTYYYQITAKRNNPRGRFDGKSNQEQGLKVWFVYASLDDKDWKYMGIINSEEAFKVTPKSEYDLRDEICKAFIYCWSKASKSEDDNRIKVKHNGNCSVCGRELTDEHSIEIGIGPTCLQRIKD